MSPSRLRSLLITCLAMLASGTFALPASSSDLPTYTVTNLGTFGGTFSDAYYLNDNGQVVGISRSASSADQAFVWDSVNGMRNLGTLGANGCRAYSINLAGQVVGQGTTAESYQRPFIWDEDNGIQLLAVPAATTGRANEINDVGQVVGRNDSQAFVWDITTGAQILPTLGGKDSSGEGINNYGQIVGHSYLASGMMRAFLWDETSGIRNLGTLGGNQSKALAVNDVGQVVGYSYNSNSIPRAFVWDQVQGMRDIGALQDGSSWAIDINNDGQIIGYTTKGSVSRAVLWTPELEIVDLNTLIPADSGWTLTTARAINEDGEIVGCGTVQGQTGTRAFLLIPEKADPVSMTYDGDTLLSTEGAATVTANLVATLYDEEGVVSNLDDAEVLFELTADAIEPIESSAYSVAGVAECQLDLEPGIYSVTVSCAAYDLTTSAVIEVYDPLSNDFVTGGGWLSLEDGATTKCARPIPRPKVEFNLNVMYRNRQCRGMLQLWSKEGPVQLRSTRIDLLVMTREKVAKFRGSAVVNNQAGCRFAATAWDNGQPGRLVDSFELNVWLPGVSLEDAPSYVFGGVLQGGNIQIHPIFPFPKP